MRCSVRFVTDIKKNVWINKADLLKLLDDIESTDGSPETTSTLSDIRNALEECYYVEPASPAKEERDD